MERRLKIYRASAGSGKTFTLALEYIRLLVEDPYVYRRILAVTFTNKATGEMKERILSKLYGVANRTSDAKDYIEKLKVMLPEKSEEQIVANAGKALRLLLHDYGHFHIQTIDAFFQTVLRGVARELDLNGDMEISLDGEELLNNAVDTYIKNLEPDTVEITQVVRYIKENLDSDGKWKVDEKIKSFAKNLLKEEYQQNGEELSEQLEKNNGELLKHFHSEVTSHYNGIIETAKNIGNRFAALSQGLEAKDFHNGKKGIWGLFEKLRSGEVIKVSDARAALISTPAKISSKCQSNNEIATLIKEAIPLYNEMITCKLSLEHYHQLSMLNNIASTLREENMRENRFLLAETTFLLSTMIDKKNATFIFEKIGTEIDHIFIDEFQDTSKLQWNCFKVLLEEVLSRGNFNLIVGDVKQSIYRWRNSDWNIMNKISTHFREGMTTFASQDVVVNGKVYKSTNYRSDRRIVEFNNALYRAAINSINSTYEEVIGPEGLKEIASAYEDVEQALPPEKPGEEPQPPKGYVEVRVLEKENDDDKFTQRAIEELMATLHRLLEVEKIAPGKITILMRTKKGKMQLVVDAFNKEFPNVRIVSDEAYKLASSGTLQLLIAALRYIALPADKVNVLNLVKLYNKVIQGRVNSMNEYIDTNNLLLTLPEEFRNDLHRLKGLPVYELIEQMLYTLNVTEANDEQAYIYAFLDHASQYIKAHNCDLDSFLAGWDETLCEKSIPAESVDSVRIMTIHKSKGLEFHTVIIPFCDWKLTGDGRTLLWCKPQMAPFNKLSMLPIDGKKDMIDSIYKKDYYNEYLYQIVDNLNILYVATTRAKSNLIMFADGITRLGHNISNLIPAVLGNITHLDGSVYDSEKKIFTFGSIVSQEEEEGKKKNNKKEEENDNPFIQKAKVQQQPFTFHKSRITFKQSRELARFLATESEEKEFKNIAEGELMHRVMSEIETKEDIDKALQRLTIEGLISTTKQYDRIKYIVERALANPKAANWFNGTYRLYNECTILCKENEKTRRPDRVMVKGSEAVVVDYKFGNEDSKHYEQVKQYMNLLTEMGYENVKGYLWYAYKNYIKEV